MAKSEWNEGRGDEWEWFFADASLSAVILERSVREVELPFKEACPVITGKG